MCVLCFLAGGCWVPRVFVWIVCFWLAAGFQVLSVRCGPGVANGVVFAVRVLVLCLCSGARHSLDTVFPWSREVCPSMPP